MLKIRGIYATALTRFFLDKGLTPASPSREILQRFSGGRFSTDGFPDVQVLDLDNGQGICVRGLPEPVERVVQLLQGRFLDVVVRGGPESSPGYEVEFPYVAKCTLDDLRNAVLPTVIHHHRLRLIASEYVDLIEQKELASHPERRKAISGNLENRLVWDQFHTGKRISIEHVKLDGRVMALSEGRITEVHPRVKKLVLKRTRFKGKGTYNGLDVPKRDGDFAITEVVEGRWFYRHTYFRRDGRWVGRYYNINTPIECYPDKIRYVDLEIDVVQWPQGNVSIVDKGDLVQKFTAGHLTAALRDAAIGASHQLKAVALAKGRIHPTAG